MRHNREAFERWRIVPRMLQGVTQRDLTTSVLGTQLSSPVLLAPIGAASVVTPNSDVIIAQGAAAAGTPYVISCQGCNPLEETATAISPWPFWYQLLLVDRRGAGRLDDQAGRALPRRRTRRHS
jgi:isopentenyl diphosphate isomerase/L-lactate dehydrogenase-like FMN-dependent dehydrogenase